MGITIINKQFKKKRLYYQNQIHKYIYYHSGINQQHGEEYSAILSSVKKMPIPQLQSKYLPNGVHDCTLDELKKSFFCNNDRRKTLINKLEEYISALRKSGISGWIILDGSFVTAEESPKKIEIVLAIIENRNYTLSSPVTQLEYTLLNESYAEEKFELRLFVGFTNTESINGFDDVANCMIQYFESVDGNMNIKKGLLKVQV